MLSEDDLQTALHGSTCFREPLNTILDGDFIVLWQLSNYLQGIMEKTGNIPSVGLENKEILGEKCRQK